MANRLAATGYIQDMQVGMMGDIWKSASLKRKSKRYGVNFFKGFKATVNFLKLGRNPISLGKTTEMIGKKVEHCCRWIQEEEIAGIAESLQGGGSGAGSSGGSW
uniref:Uncharacterized protein n=2 Tax=Oryza sativa subsp. japonica TaxID=39947 RepID=A0A5S6RAQ4_ORYSJ|nr:hypothetical protein [Oryza sativa Japonica Group]AAP54206.1 hypothetical protein LOC_Os10g33020 [Oryza sativa Japonica Group]